MTASNPEKPGDELQPTEYAAWRMFLDVSSRGLDQIDQSLQRQSNMALNDYEILRTLAESEQRRLRMSELADRVFVSRSRLTYRVDRLTEVGFVTREECEDDRRGLWAILTDKGVEAFRGATPGHHQTVHELLFETLDNDDLDAFQQALQVIADRINSA